MEEMILNVQQKCYYLVMKMNDQYNQCYSLFFLLAQVERLRLPLFNFSIPVPLFHYTALILNALMRW